jgi:hypothetical protein
MPRVTRGGRSGYQGNFGFYATPGTGGNYPSDEEAIADACDVMFTMCGNAGQETLIGDYLGDFEAWASDALEAEGAADDFDTFADMVISWYDGRMDKWHATNQIWSQGYAYMSNQSGYHDGADEVGEGTGELF